MTSDPQTEAFEASQDAPTHNVSRWLLPLGLLMTAICVWIEWLGRTFDSSMNPADRPLLSVLFLLAGAFLVYLLACCEVWPTDRRSDSGSPWWRSTTLWQIVGFGLLFRVILLFSIPIQEIDIYRYVLDGAVSNAGGDPFEFAPLEINRAITRLSGKSISLKHDDLVFARSDEETRRLEQLAQYVIARPGLQECAERIHFGKYTTPYPPVSQAVFRVATWFVPSFASHYGWLIGMKAVLLLFDVAAGLLLIALLRACRLPESLSIVYWWCPLVLKEIANSGHLDSIAIFLTVAFAFSVATAIRRHEASERSSRSKLTSIASAILLGLAVAAKIYPLVLAPAWAISLIKRTRVWAVLPVTIFVLVGGIGMWPMVWHSQVGTESPSAEVVAEDERLLEQKFAQLDAVGYSKVSVLRRPKPGVVAFSEFWEMNDLIFMVIVENARVDQPTDGTGPWFVVTSEAWRSSITDYISESAEVSAGQVAFWLARRTTLLIFVLLTCYFCWLAWRATSAAELMPVFFLSLAWFWLLSPTQNPWYWVWAMPFLVFLKRPGPWLLISGTVLLYYLRFYFEQHYPHAPVAGTPYKSYLFFDYVVPWVEFAPVLVALLIPHSFWHRLIRIKS